MLPFLKMPLTDASGDTESMTKFDQFLQKNSIPNKNSSSVTSVKIQNIFKQKTFKEDI